MCLAVITAFPALPTAEPLPLGPGIAPAAAPEPRVTLPEIESEVMCPICGTLLELSRAPAAQRERAFIRKLIRQGKSKDEIKEALVAEYGGQVLAEPKREGINLWAYAVPTGLIILAALAVTTSIIRLRRNSSDSDPGEHPGTGDGPEGDGSDHGDHERLDRDMARFDL